MDLLMCHNSVADRLAGNACQTTPALSPMQDREQLSRFYRVTLR